MSKKSFRKNLFEITSPCSQDWEAMKGNDKVRFCEHCALEVNNISTMRRKDAMRMVRESENRICVRYVKNPANNQPVFTDKLYQIGHRAPRLAVGAMTAALSLSSMVYAQGGVSLNVKSETQTEIAQEKDSKKDKTEKPTASISGTISDPSGAVIPGIFVSLTAENASRTVTSANDEGFYEFKNLAPGTYTLEAEGENGFTTAQIEGIAVSDGVESKKDVTMEVGAAMVTVGDIGAIEYELPLLQAVSDEDMSEMKTLLASGADVNGKDKNYDGITAIFVAVESGNIETVRTLLEFGAKINARDESKRTPLMRLDNDATPELVKMLLSYGAKIKAVDEAGNNVLHHAVVYADAEIIQVLISEGAKMDAPNEDGQTPLMIAAEYENIEAAKTLLNAGANINLRDKKDRTALGIALENDYKELAELLISLGAEE